jgi:glutamate-5-semialdehyde dehydrogenase
MSLLKQLSDLAVKAKKASRQVVLLSTAEKNKILKSVAVNLVKQQATIIRANNKDMAYADKAGLSTAMKDRLKLDKKRIKAMADAVKDVARLKDPVGEVLKKWKRPNGLELTQVRVPLGVILIIFESRPNVTSECASLCLKSGNAVILRGGKEAFYSNQAISRIYQSVLKRFKVDPAAVSFVNNTDRKSVKELLQLNKVIDLAIPRGGEGLIRHAVEVSRIPLVKHDKGLCHVYIDKDADLKKAQAIAVNAKCQRPSVCNAMETLLIHEKVAQRLIPNLLNELKEAGCTVKLGSKAARFAKSQSFKKATAKDWDTEYLELILSIDVVKDLKGAVSHIERHGSGHTESIVTKNKITAQAFIDQVDASSVMVNASTRFSDGNEYGFGAEIGISTDKLHARGPMGLEGLTIYKYIVKGNGQVRN